MLYTIKNNEKSALGGGRGAPRIALYKTQNSYHTCEAVEAGLPFRMQNMRQHTRGIIIGSEAPPWDE